MATFILSLMSSFINHATASDCDLYNLLESRKKCVIYKPEK